MGDLDNPTRPGVLSVCVVLGDQRARAERCLARLLSQTAIERMEIVVADVAPRHGAPAAASHPKVRYLPVDEDSHFGQARGAAFRRSSGEFVASLEDHCYAEPEWAEAVLRAFREPGVDLVNYAMSNANSGDYVSETFLMAEYGRWMHPASTGYVPISACNNVAYRRSCLETWWEDLDELLESEYHLHRRLQDRGSKVWLAGRARVQHETWERLSDGLRANNAMKRLLACRRAAAGRWSRWHRLFYFAAMPLTPVLHLWRLGVSLIRRPALWPLFVKSLPLCVFVYTTGSFAEAQGYLFGAGESRILFRDMEVSISRIR